MCYFIIWYVLAYDLGLVHTLLFDSTMQMWFIFQFHDYAGVSMSLYIMGRCNDIEDDVPVVQQLEEMHQVCPLHSLQLLLWISFPLFGE